MYLLFGSMALAVVVGFIQVIRSPELLRLGGFTFLAAGVGLGGFSMVPETDGLPFWGYLMLIAIGIVMLWAANIVASKGPDQS